MKKKITCLLSLTLLMGCTHLPIEEELPEEPPVVEEDLPPVREWLPEEKEYISILDSYSVKPYENDEQSEYMIELMTYEDGSEFENWYNTSYFMEARVFDIHLNIESEDVHHLNELLHEKYVSKTDIVGNPVLDYRYFNDLQTISLVLKDGSYILTDHRSKMLVYNIDIESGVLINNNELLERYDFTIDDVKNSMKVYYDAHQNDCVETETSSNCRTHYELIHDENIQVYPLLQMNGDLYIIGYFNQVELVPKEVVTKGLISYVAIKIEK